MAGNLDFSLFTIHFSLQMVFKVAGDDVVEMHSVGTHHVVTVAGIGEEVGIGTSIDAGPHERQRVLRHTDRVVSSIDDEETAF